MNILLKALKGLFGLSVLFAFYVLAKTLCVVLSIDFPPALIALLMLFCVFYINRGIPVFMRPICQLLLNHMALFLIPAVLAVVIYLSFIAANALSLTLAIVVSSIISLLVTVYVAIATMPEQPSVDDSHE
mgnify:CR=1 FL=1